MREPDLETGYYYLLNRYYDPATAQFLTPDPLFAMTGSRYGYADNNPLNNDDPLGLCAHHSGILGGLRDAGCHVGNTANNDVGAHWRGIAQAAVVVAAGVGTAACLSTTVLCLGLTPLIGAATGAALYALSNEPHNAAGYRRAELEGAAVASLSGLCAVGVCGPAALGLGLDLGAGGAAGVYDYSRSDGCHTLGGYLGAFGKGSIENAPLPVGRLPDGSE